MCEWKVLPVKTNTYVYSKHSAVGFLFDVQGQTVRIPIHPVYVCEKDGSPTMRIAMVFTCDT